MNTLIFLHVPKAAGSSFVKILHSNYSESVRFDVSAGGRYVDNLEILREMSPARKDELRVVYGHLPFGVHELLPQQSQYISILRNPIDRIVSHYYFVREQPKHYLHSAVVGQNLSLAEYVQSGLSGELTNGMTRLLSGRPSQDSLRGHDPCTEEDFFAAVRHIHHHFSAVGIVEQYDRSLSLFCRMFGWKNTARTRLNVTRSRVALSSLDNRTLRIIEEHNAYDLELYAMVLQRFETQCNALNVYSSEEGVSLSGSFIRDLWDCVYRRLNR